MRGSPDIDIGLSADLRAPAAARRAIARFRLPSDLSHDAQLVVTELVTNSIRHAHSDGAGTINVRGWVSGGRIRLEVIDDGPGFDGVRSMPPADSLEGGRGLPLVIELSDAWGARRTGRGRWLVWADIGGPFH